MTPNLNETKTVVLRHENVLDLLLLYELFGTTDDVTQEVLRKNYKIRIELTNCDILTPWKVTLDLSLEEDIDLIFC